jgi:hypothetical protein
MHPKFARNRMLARLCGLDFVVLSDGLSRQMTNVENQTGQLTSRWLPTIASARSATIRARHVYLSATPLVADGPALRSASGRTGRVCVITS